MSKLLIDESPLVILPSLAKEIGLNEAIILQQIQYWIKIKEKTQSKMGFYDNQYWIYNTIEEWEEQFSFWSKNTIKRTFNKLKEMNLILVEKFNKHKWDHTKFYTINYDELYNIEQNIKKNITIGATDEPKLSQSQGPKRANHKAQKEPIFYTETTTETTTETIIKDLTIFWNSCDGLPTHKESVIKKNVKKKHSDIVNQYGYNKIKGAVETYEKIINSNEYYFNHRWAFWDFIQHAYKFMEDMQPFQNYKDRNIKDLTKEEIKEFERIKDKKRKIAFEKAAVNGY